VRGTRGLVRNPGAWIWSSYLFYEKREGGLVPVDPWIRRELEK